MDPDFIELLRSTHAGNRESQMRINQLIEQCDHSYFRQLLLGVSCQDEQIRCTCCSGINTFLNSKNSATQILRSNAWLGIPAEEQQQYLNEMLARLHLPVTSNALTGVICVSPIDEGQQLLEYLMETVIPSLSQAGETTEDQQQAVCIVCNIVQYCYQRRLDLYTSCFLKLFTLIMKRPTRQTLRPALMAMATVASVADGVSKDNVEDLLMLIFKMSEKKQYELIGFCFEIFLNGLAKIPVMQIQCSDTIAMEVLLVAAQDLMNNCENNEGLQTQILNFFHGVFTSPTTEQVYGSGYIYSVVERVVLPLQQNLALQCLENNIMIEVSIDLLRTIISRAPEGYVKNLVEFLEKHPSFINIRQKTLQGIEDIAIFFNVVPSLMRFKEAQKWKQDLIDIFGHVIVNVTSMGDQTQQQLVARLGFNAMGEIAGLLEMDLVRGLVDLCLQWIQDPAMMSETLQVLLKCLGKIVKTSPVAMKQKGVSLIQAILDSRRHQWIEEYTVVFTSYLVKDILDPLLQVSKDWMEISELIYSYYFFPVTASMPQQAISLLLLIYRIQCACIFYPASQQEIQQNPGFAIEQHFEKWMKVVETQIITMIDLDDYSLENVFIEVLQIFANITCINCNPTQYTLDRLVDYVEKIPENELFCTILESTACSYPFLSNKAAQQLLDKAMQVLSTPNAVVTPQNSCVLMIQNMQAVQRGYVNPDIIWSLAEAIVNAEKTYSYVTLKDSQLVGLLLNLIQTILKETNRGYEHADMVITLIMRYLTGFDQRRQRAFGAPGDVDEQFALRMDSILVLKVTNLIYQLFNVQQLCPKILHIVRDNKDLFKSICYFLRDINMDVRAIHFEMCFEGIIQIKPVQHRNQ